MVALTTSMLTETTTKIMVVTTGINSISNNNNDGGSCNNNVDFNKHKNIRKIKLVLNRTSAFGCPTILTSNKSSPQFVPTSAAQI